jgi:hypothetical protein
MPKLTKDEFDQVTDTFVNRLRAEMSSAGCNDLFTDEFPQSVCDKFSFDHALLEEWKKGVRNANPA